MVVNIVIIRQLLFTGYTVRRQSVSTTPGKKRILRPEYAQDTAPKAAEALRFPAQRFRASTTLS